MMMYWLLIGFVFQLMSVSVMFLLPANPPVAFWAVLDVGQGDASLLHTATGYNILIDTGPDESVLSALDQVLPPFDRTIDLLFITHPHADHINGALYVLDRYHVGGVVMSDVQYQSVQYDLLKRKIREQGVLLFEARSDQDWQIDQQTSLDILFPFTTLHNQLFKNVNNASIVMMLKTRAEQILLTGDMEEELELLLSKYYGDKLAAQVLKVGHHGSKTSSSELLLHLVRPNEMFISVGHHNSFNHPSAQTLARLQQLGNVKRTDEVGTIIKILL